MLSFEPNVVFIDDKVEEIDGIVKCYQNQGVGTLYFNAHLHTGDSKPENTFSNVNLIFLDIYFTSNVHDYDPELCSSWVEKIIPENSFYILVFWSQDTQHVEELLQELEKINRIPYKYFEEQKSDYKIKESWDFEKLKSKIDYEIKKDTELEELTLWKKSLINSSNNIIGHLSNKMNSDGLITKLQKIIIGHGGTRYFSNNNFDQKRMVLFEALDNVLNSNSKQFRPKKEISQCNKEKLYNITQHIQSEIDTKLNSWFHFNLFQKIDKTLISPGLVSIFENQCFKNTYSIIDDNKIENKLKIQIESDQTKIDDIVVVLNRPCDIAQNKYGKNIKLLSGIKVTNPIRYNEEELTSRQKKNKEKYINEINFNNSKLPDSTKLFDHLYFSDTEPDVFILFDFRYVFSVPETLFIDKFENIKIFNKELISELQVEYNSYSNRLGITQII